MGGLTVRRASPGWPGELPREDPTSARRILSGRSGDVASAEGGHGRDHQGQRVAPNEGGGAQGGAVDQWEVLRLVGDHDSEVVAQQPRRPAGAKPTDGVLHDGEVTEGDPQGGGGGAADGGDREADQGPHHGHRRDPQPDAGNRPHPGGIDAVGGAAPQPRRQQHDPEQQLQHRRQGEGKGAGGDQLGQQDPDPAGFPGQQGGHGAGVPLGPDQRRAQQPAQQDRKPAHPFQDPGEALVVEPAVLDGRADVLVAELGPLLGWEVGRHLVQLAGDALLDLGLAGHLSLGQGSLVHVAGDQEGDRGAGQDGQHGQGDANPDQPPGNDATYLHGQQGSHRATSSGCSAVSSRKTVSRSASSGRSSVTYRPWPARAWVTVAACSGGRATRRPAPSSDAGMPAAARTARPRSRSSSRTSRPAPWPLASTSATGPAATQRPRAKMATRSQVWRTSESRWLDTNTVWPSSPRPRSRSRTSLMPAGSRPLAGSSKISTSGSLSSAAARPSRCRMPSE